MRASHEHGLDDEGAAWAGAAGRQLLFLIATESNGKNNNSAFNFIALSTLLGLA